MAVLEITEVVVTPGKEEEFGNVVRSLLPIFGEAEGFLSLKLLRAVDKEGVLLLFIEWQSIEHHTEVFAKTEAFLTVRSAVAPFFTAPPRVLHAIEVIDGV